MTTRAIREALVSACETVDRIREVSKAAGIRPEYVDWSGSTVTVAFHVVSEAEKCGKLEALVTQITNVILP